MDLRPSHVHVFPPSRDLPAATSPHRETLLRSGCAWTRGLGRVFYFQPGHETCPSYHDKNVQLVITNAVRWAYRPQPVYRPVTDHTTALKDISLGKRD